MLKSIFIFLAIFNLSLLSQDVSWKPEEATEAKFQLFHSTRAINQPTAETIKKGDFIYGIEHRFNSSISSGAENLWGIDGGATMKMHLGYAINDDLLIDLSRSSKNAAYEINVKQRLLEIKNESLPTLITGNFGFAYNTKAVPSNFESSRKIQPFAQLIINSMYNNKLGFGLVTSYVNNTNIGDKSYIKSDYSLTMGIYGQYFINENWALILEATPTLVGWRDTYNSYAFGAEFETGGHFFKFLFGNNTNMSTAQFNSGASEVFSFQNLHFGFQITRDL